MACKHKKDKYGCKEGCKEHYPVISREAIIAEMDASEEMYKEQPCERCKDLINGLQTVIEGQQIMIKSLLD